MRRCTSCLSWPTRSPARWRRPLQTAARPAAGQRRVHPAVAGPEWLAVTSWGDPRPAHVVGPAGYLLAPPGGRRRAGRSSDMLSYLLFDVEYSSELMDLRAGRRARKDSWKRFLTTPATWPRAKLPLTHSSALGAGGNDPAMSGSSLRDHASARSFLVARGARLFLALSSRDQLFLSLFDLAARVLHSPTQRKSPASLKAGLVHTVRRAYAMGGGSRLQALGAFLTSNSPSAPRPGSGSRPPRWRCDGKRRPRPIVLHDEPESLFGR